MEEKKQQKVKEETKKQQPETATEKAEEAKCEKEETKAEDEKAEEKKSSWKKDAMIIAGGAAVGALIANDTSRNFIVDCAKSTGKAIGSGLKSLWGKIKGKKEEPAAVEADEQPQQIGFTSLEESSPVTIERRDWREQPVREQRERTEPQQVAAEAQNPTRQQFNNNRPRFEREGKKFN